MLTFRNLFEQKKTIKRIMSVFKRLSAVHANLKQSVWSRSSKKLSFFCLISPTRTSLYEYEEGCVFELSSIPKMWKNEKCKAIEKLSRACAFDLFFIRQPLLVRGIRAAGLEYRPLLNNHRPCFQLSASCCWAVYNLQKIRYFPLAPARLWIRCTTENP